MATWRRGAPGDDVSSQVERELYERARDATKEAQRQGDAQLQAAVAAASVEPVREVRAVQALTQRSAWSLKFGDPRLEKAYLRKSTTHTHFSDSIPTACELALCIFQIWFEFDLSQKPQPREGLKSFLHLRYTFNHLYGYVCSAAVSTLVLLLQLVFVKWYGSNRCLTMWYYVGMLWLWEGLKLFLVADEERRFAILVDSQFGILQIVQVSASLAFVRCILISLIYQVPFCMHLHSRMCAFGGQILATISRGKVEGMHILLLSVTAGHLVGLMLAYRLDLRARTAFVQSLPRYLVDGSNGNGPGEQFSSYRASFSRQMWSIFYPELFEKSEFTDHVGSIASERSAPHRALGGFAGGFGGVSGLKCANFATAAPLSSSSNSLGEQERSNSSEDEYIADSGFLEPQIPHGLGNSTLQYVTHGRSQSSATSACSIADSDWNWSMQTQAQRRRGS